MILEKAQHVPEAANVRDLCSFWQKSGHMNLYLFMYNTFIGTYLYIFTGTQETLYIRLLTGTCMASEETNGAKEKVTTTIEVDKDLFLRFKALCVMTETTISGEIEGLIRKKVEDVTK
jgi:hypothetical protein